MKKKNFWKMFVLTGLLSLAAFSTVTSAQTPKSGTAFLIRYSDLANDFTTGCELKRPSLDDDCKCRWMIKELKDDYDNFLEEAEAIAGKIKAAKKWNKELDDTVMKYSGKGGLTAAEMEEIKNAGGYRAFYEKTIRELQLGKDKFKNEVKEIETKQKSASIQNQVFQTVSYTSRVEDRKIPDALREILKKVKQVADAFVAFCEATKWCQ
jgi:uncharacterized protein YutE (UPF0331/DUF86 family)